MAGQETVTIEALRQLSEDLEQVQTALESAKSTVEASGEVDGSAFSLYGIEMQVAFPITHAFMVRNLEGKIAHVESIRERLKSTAATWASAEQSSTVPAGSGG